MGYPILVVIVATFGWWRLLLRFWPYAPCRWCRGRKGNNLGSGRGRWGNCSRCGGRGSACDGAHTGSRSPGPPADVQAFRPGWKPVHITAG
jgi:hypothetical protein